ncbi:MAG: protein kinase [Thermoanaerobaculales bacterium]|nr:protein kinase [Thermoanaerobaculales bacterium]
MDETPRRTATGSPSLTDSVNGSSKATDPPPQWDRYEELSFVGRGGMGQVYRAWDPRLQRPVALKFLCSENLRAVARFTREAQAQAQVNHPNICGIYETGEVDGRPYIAMQYIEGESLSTKADELDRETKIAVVADLARAAHAAHLKGLIHRDIKPSNVMLGTADDGGLEVKVVDFGLSMPFLQRDQEIEDRAEAGSGETVHTPDRRWMVAGTPSYMAPEQALGLEEKLDARTDVYAIGCTLYELFLGRPPLSAESTMELLLKVMSEEPDPPRSLDPTIAPELEAIILKCLRKDPRERYQTAQELAEDLDAFLERRVVMAFEGGPFYRVRSLARRSPAVTVLAAFLVLSTLVATAMWVATAWRSSRQVAAAQRFGHEAAQLEALLWKARSLERHDMQATNALVRERMRVIEKEIERRGRVARGPGSYALGVTSLSLGEVDAALAYLEAAIEDGFETPEVSAAMGLALGRLYQRGLAHVDGIADEHARASEKARIERDYRDRARSFLHEAKGSALIPQPLVEGLLALYENRVEDGLRLARKSFETAPWSYEARWLEGDLLATKARTFDDATDAEALYEDATKAFRQALAIAPSDPRCHLRLARLLAQRLYAIQNSRLLIVEADMDTALKAAENILEVMPDSFEAYLVLAGLYRIWAQQHTVFSLGDHWPWVERAKAAVAEAQNLAPEHAEVLAVAGEVYLNAAKAAVNSGRDPSQDLVIVVDCLKKSIRTVPSYSKYNSLGVALRRLASWDMKRGEAVAVSLEAAAAAFQQATNLDPNRHEGWSNLAWVRLNQAQLAAKHGDDSIDLLHESVAIFRRALECDHDAIIFNNLGMAQTELAEQQGLAGYEPLHDLEAAAASFEEAITIYPGYSYAHNNLANALVESARWELAHGRNPGAFLDRAETALKTAAERKDYASPWFNRGLVYQLKAQLTMALGEDPTTALEEAADALTAGLELRPGVAPALVELSRVHAMVARWQLGENRQPLAALVKAREAAAEATTLDPSLSDAWALRAVVATLEARAQIASPEAAAADLREAFEAISKARENNSRDREVVRAALLVSLEVERQGPELVAETVEDFRLALAAAHDYLERCSSDAEILLLAGLLETTGEGVSESAGKLRARKALEQNPWLRAWYAGLLIP